MVYPRTALYKLAVPTDDGVRFYFDGKLLVYSWFDRAPATDIVTVKLEASRSYQIKNIMKMGAGR